MKTANTGAFFGRRDAGRDISKTIPLVKLAHKILYGRNLPELRQVTLDH